MTYRPWPPSLHVVGNGPGDAPRLALDVPVVFFNPADLREPRGLEAFVSNHRHRGYRKALGRPFIVESAWLDSADMQRIEAALATSAASVEAQLGCFPSAGIATVHAALAQGARVHVHRMPLKPDFLRHSGMGPRQALPGAYHNWLGERRVALELLRSHGATCLSWASLRLRMPGDEPQRGDAKPVSELLALLEDTQSSAREHFARELERLAGFDLRTWLQGTDLALLREIEPYLFLDRRSRITGNWWLYCDRCAPGLDAVLGRLMLCQQALAEPATGTTAEP